MEGLDLWILTGDRFNPPTPKYTLVTKVALLSAAGRSYSKEPQIKGAEADLEL